MTSILKIINDGNGIFIAAINNSDSVQNMFLETNGSAETITVPTDADIAIFSSNGDFWANFNGQTATVPADEIAAGVNGHVLNPAVRQVTPGGTISIISDTDDRQVSIEWFKSKGDVS